VDGTAQQVDGVVYRLIYRSRSVIPEQERRAELGRLFSAARSHNKKRQITGALLLLGDCFVQTLEGDEDEVQALLARIRADSRHDSLEVLETEMVAGRVFGRWSMAKVAAAQDEPDLPLIANVKGISPAAPRGDSTPEQEEVLQVMREAARGRQPV
jgi:hypothetical protein